MHDLRRQALESGKTVSRKAKSKQSSTASSRGNSAANSRVGSKNVSRSGSDDEEGGNLSDETSFRYVHTWRSPPERPAEGTDDGIYLQVPVASVNPSPSVNSIDEMVATEDTEPTTDAWRLELADKIEETIDRKRSSVQGREATLAAYIRILTSAYADEEVRGKEMELVPAFLKSIKAETSEKETILAMKALAMTLITSPSDAIYDAAAPVLKRTILDSESIATKSAAIHTLGTCTFYGGASEDEILENMTYLLEIVSSDGQFISATDEPAPVVTALEEWGFLATLIEDLSDETEDAMETFVEQLESSDPAVQIAAGENIALLYEKSYTPPEENEIISDSDDDIPEDPDDAAGSPKLVKRYDAYRRTDQLVHILGDLAKLSSRSLSKKDKKSLHTNFSDILNSVENPTRGPRYQNAISHETGRRYGSRMAVRIHKDGVMRIDKWWKLMRLKGLRRVLQGGFVTHYERNGVVFESLPIMITTDRKAR